MPERAVNLRAVLAPVAFVLFMSAFGRAFDTYIQYVFCLCLVAAVIGVAMVPLVGYGKIVMLAGGAMMGVGAYLSSLLIINYHTPFLVAVLAAALAGALAGLALGLPSIRFRGHHLAMVTLVFQSLGIIILREWKSVTGGAEGIRVPRAVILGYEFHDDASNLLLLGGFASISLLIVGILLRSSFGKVLRAISLSEVGATAFGVHIPSFKIAAFALSCSFLALGGAILAPQLKIIDPESFGLMQSINALAYPIVGGMTSVWGGLVGGVLLRALPETLRSFADYAELAFAIMALISILVLPSGLTGGIAELAASLRRVGEGRFSKGSRQRDAQLSKHSAVELRSTANAGVAHIHCQATDLGSSLAVDAIDVKKSFGDLVAVAGLSLQVQTGKIHGLIGPNGAGKTTLFNIISGFTEPDEGKLLLFGIDGRKVEAFNRVKIGVTRTFQHVAIFEQLSCRDNVVIGLGENGVGQSVVGSISDILQGSNSARRNRLADEALDMVGLSRRRNDRAGNLSLGDQRRLEIARAIVSSPRLLLLDEPVSGVDREDEQRLAELLKRLNKEWNLTMLLIEHNVRFVVECCHRLSAMNQGLIVAEGDPQQIMASDLVQKVYFGKI